MTTLDAIPALPVGTRLVHIGPPKTGTTTLQAACDRSRRAVLAQGVRYAGRRRHSREAVIAATGTGPGTGQGSARGQREWQAIIREVRSARDDRVLFSSERLSHARPDAIKQIVEQLGGHQVHVAVTVRPITRVLQSQWQQSVQSGLVTSLEGWLRDVLEARPDDPKSVLYRQRHDRLIERWADVVGTDSVTVIVPDDQDRVMLLRAFERLLGLHSGTLELHRDLSNRSMTWPEVEAVRALNLRYKAEGLPPNLYRSLVERGASFRMRMRDPRSEEPPIVLPAWAALELEPIGREIVAGITRTRVRVIGDLDVLAASGVAPAPSELPAARISPATAAALAAGLLGASGVMSGDATAASGGSDLRWVPLRRLAGILVRRLRRRAAARLGALMRTPARP